MTDPKKPVRVDQVAWAQLLPWLAIFKTFRMAIRPSKLAVALVMLILVFVMGHGLDVIWGPQALPGEVDSFGAMSADQFATWRQNQLTSSDPKLNEILRKAFYSRFTREQINEALAKPNKFAVVRSMLVTHYDELRVRFENDTRQNIEAGSDAEKAHKVLGDKLKLIADDRASIFRQIDRIQPIGIFRATFEYKFNAFDRLVQSAIGLNFGFDQIMAGQNTAPNTVVGSLRSMLLILPAWLYRTHPGFLSLLSICMLFIMALFGGALARLAAMDATGASHEPVMGAFGFVLNRYLWFVLTPLLPVIMIGVLGLLLVLGGLVFFNVPGLDLVGGLLFFIALGLGLAITILLLFTLATYPLFYPALVMEGSDSFDAVSRSFGYLVARPWHWLFYSILALVYGAVGYLFLGSVIYLTLSIAHTLIGMGVVTQMADETSRWNAIMPKPALGQLLYTIDWNGGLGFTGKLAAGMIWVWSFFLTSLIGAYTVSFFYCSNTVIYQLLRQSSEQTRPDEIAADTKQTNPTDPNDTPDKMENPQM